MALMDSLFGEGQTLDFDAFSRMLEQEISAGREGLMNFDFGQPADLNQPMQGPNWLQAIGAALQVPANPNKASEFTQRVDAIRQYNNKLKIAALQQQEEARRQGLLRQFGIDYDQYKSLLDLRSELLGMQLKKRFGIDDPIQGRFSLEATERGLSSENGAALAETLKNSPSSLAAISEQLPGNPGPEAAIAWIESTVQGGRGGEFDRERKKVREEQAEERLGISQTDLTRRLTESVESAAGSIADIKKEISDLEASVKEAEGKLSPSGFEKLVRWMRGQVTEEAFTEAELNEPIRLKTMVDGKNKFTLKELMEKVQTNRALLRVYLSRGDDRLNQLIWQDAEQGGETQQQQTTRPQQSGAAVTDQDLEAALRALEGNQ